MDMHEALYGDTARVADARVQAGARIAAKALRVTLIDAWAYPVIDWLSSRLVRR